MNDTDAPTGSGDDAQTHTDDETDDLADWLRLVLTPGIGRGTARQLLARFGLPRDVLAQPKAVLRSVLNAPLADALKQEPADGPAPLDAVRAWLRGGPDRHVLTLGDARYPQALLTTPDPPLLLYAHGRLECLQGASIAIVGSRNPTAQGLDHARAFSRALGQRGYTIVSGLALGIDGAAHEGALDNPASTVAVIGTGIDRIYPARHDKLARRIADHGVIISELPLGAPPLAEHFPQRNRIIAGLAQGTLVVEAAVASGSLITAKMAADYGREVFALPGSIHSPQSRGCHALIRQGAKLVETAEDVIEELQPAAQRTATAAGSIDRSKVSKPMRDDANADAATSAASSGRDGALLAAMGYDPVPLDTILDRTGLDTATAQARLLDLELDGVVRRLPGGRFQRRGGA